MKIEQVAPNALLITLSNAICIESLQVVQKAYHNIKNLEDKYLLEITPSYTTIFIAFDTQYYHFDELKDKLLEIVNLNTLLKLDEILVNIDVYYGREVGLDLDKIASEKNLSVEDIIHIHSSKVYDVYAMGFLPGFAFLGQIDERIATHRLRTPRNKVAKGSVAIADTQTAIYPTNSAGGWNIIGKTCKELFFKTNSLDSISLLDVGKQVKFNPITKNEFLANGGKL
jgi:KipI family sensor histidine kinase inhibitor